MELAVTTLERMLSPRTRVGATDTAVWILHGMPSEDPINLCGHEQGDAVWYAEMFDAYLSESLGREDTPLHEHVRDGVYTMLDLLGEQAASTDYNGANLPAAMLVCVRVNEEAEQLEYFTIGDTVLLLDNGETKHRVCAADSAMHKPEFDPEHQRALRFSADVIEYARYGQLDASNVERAIAFTTAVDFALTAQEAAYDTPAAFLDDGNDVEGLTESAEQYQSDASLPRDANDIAVFEAMLEE